MSKMVLVFIEALQKEINIAKDDLILFQPTWRGGGDCNVFPWSLQNTKESDLGHLSNLFYILCSHFDEKKVGGTTLSGGRVSHQSQRMGVDVTWQI